MTFQIQQSDVIAWAQSYTGIPFHALLADAPYTIDFMGKSWDRDGIAFRPDTWKALAQHLLPGAFLMIFGGSRTYHRLACALEDAGLILHPALGWVTGQGFPKATRIPDDAFTGHRYGRQALKPAFEFIAVAQVPYAGQPVHSIIRYGAGSLWIDGGRVPSGADHRDKCDSVIGLDSNHNGQCYGTWHGKRESSWIPAGRWPPNLALVHTPQCVPLGTQRVQTRSGTGGKDATGCEHGYIAARVSVRTDNHPGHAAPDGTEVVPAYQCVDGCPVAELDQQAGYRDAGGQSHKLRATPKTQDIYGHYAYSGETPTYHDSGPASRYFAVHDWTLDIAERLHTSPPIHYASKASPSERSQGLTGTNPHPCLKPISLCTWLSNLLLPPVAYAPRRLLIPFAGTGSEMIGAFLAGFEDILGVEISPEYVSIAQQRLAWHQRQPWQGVLL